MQIYLQIGINSFPQANSGIDSLKIAYSIQFFSYICLIPMQIYLQIGINSFTQANSGINSLKSAHSIQFFPIYVSFQCKFTCKLEIIFSSSQ